MRLIHTLYRPVTITLATALAAMLVAMLPAQAAEDIEVHEYTLDNGMRLLVKPDERAPVVVSQLWFPVGSSYELPGTTGVSHALEHMMFKATDNLESGEFSRFIAREGGRQNAFTGRDYTSYFEQLRADRLEIAFELEAERLANIRFDAEEFSREMDVIQEERRLRVDDDPVSVAHERFNALAWATNPYRQPIIGWPSDLDQLTLEDIRNWYERHYSVSNAILVVAGDVDPEAVNNMASKHFGGIEPRSKPDIKLRPEIPALGEQRATLQVDNATPYVVMGYRAPSLATTEERREVYALSLLASILDGGESARLPERLVRGSGVASSVSASYNGIARLDTQFTLAGRPGRDGSLDNLEDALRGEIRRIIDDGVTAEELEQTRIQSRADYVYRLDSLFYQAMEIGMLETTGIGWEAITEFPTAIEEVTVDDIQAVAERYLNDQRLTVVHLLPSGDSETPSIPAPGETDAPDIQGPIN